MNAPFLKLMIPVAVFLLLANGIFASGLTGEPIAKGIADNAVASNPYGNDFEGNGISDFGVFDSNNGHWYAWSLANGLVTWAEPWGWPGAIPVPGDYDGDGRADLAVFDSNNGHWYVASLSEISNLKSQMKALRVLAWAQPWGWPGAIPVPGDYDGDGRDDLAVFDSNTGNWYVWSLANGLVTWAEPWGWPGAIPVPGDYDGDSRSDLAVFDSNTGNWYIASLSEISNLKSRMQALRALVWAKPWGWPSAVPVSGDFNGDSRSDLAVFDCYVGNWYICSLADEIIAWADMWGWPGARPVSGDFDGDGHNDLAAFDSITGHWYVKSLTNGTLAWSHLWGWPGAIPIGMPIYLVMSGNATLDASANPTDGGTVTGSGTYPVGLQVTITATAALNWEFIGWDDGNTQAVRAVVVPFGGVDYVASFAHEGATLAVSANPAEGGTVTGSGTYPVDSMIEITATASSGWFFSGWNDGDMQIVRTVTVPATGAVYIATFEKGGIITVSAEPVNGGSVTGGGTYAVGAQVKIIASPNSGWTFSKWDDDNIEAARTITVSAAGASYIASFTPGSVGHLTRIGHYATAGAKDVALYGGAYACVVDGTNGWFIINIANPAKPTLVSHTQLTGICNNIVVYGNYAYVSTSGDYNEGLVVYDIFNPANPSKRQTIAGQYIGLSTYGGTLYAGLNTPTFKVYNMNAPSLLALLGQYNSPSMGGRFALSGGYAYVATFASTILTLDVSVSSSPLLKATYSTGNKAWDVAISGNTMYVAAGNNGLEIVDISTPYSPMRVGHYYFAGLSSKCVAISGTRCYLGSPDGNSRLLEIVDISTPSLPARVDHVTTDGYARALLINGQYLYVAEESAGATSAGLTIYRIE